MKNVLNYKLVILLAFVVLFFTSCHSIRVEINATGGGVLEDAVLFVSDDGFTPRNTYILGDIDLSGSLFTFRHTVDTVTSNHWWLIGSMSGDVVYSSALQLNGVDMYTIEPYTGAQLAWNIPANLHSYVARTNPSMDWLAQTMHNHSSHVAANKTVATLWRFSDGGRSLGTIEINLKTN